MEDFKLENIDPEDVEDLLGEVEKSFNIRFVGDELIGIKNFGELCDHIINKIQLENFDDCTSQQAFYKLRNAISTELKIDKKEITRQKKLEELFARKLRRSNLKNIEQELGFKLKILTSPGWVILPLVVIFLLSFICFFFSSKIALSGIAFSLLGFWIADLTANEIELENVGQLAEKMTRENYLQSRRNQGTFNKREIEKVLTDWFSDKLGLEKTELTRDAKFV
ncbi:MAG: hypothetical protein EOO87_18990 [Pedobacter sp.]|nr:MAG: hypothetical protein EOO87_18990 [Pedobacter sp.]